MLCHVKVGAKLMSRGQGGGGENIMSHCRIDSCYAAACKVL